MAVDKLMNETQGDDIIDRLEEIADKIHDINYGLETSSNKVVSMSGYQKESTAAAISPGDSLNVAVGKLEKKVDDNTANKVAGPQSAAVGNIATFANVDGKSVQDSEVAIVTTMDDTSDAEVPTSEAIGEYITDQKFAVGLDDSSSTANHLVKFKDNNGKNLEDTGISVETSSASALSNDDSHIPTSKLVKTEVDKKVTSIKAPVSGSSTKVDKNNEVAFQQASGQNPAVTVTGDATNGTVTIEHATGAGFNHIPTSGTSGQYLKNTGTAGNGAWTSPLTEWPATPEHTDTLPSTKLLDDRFDADEENILSLYKQNGKTFNLADVYSASRNSSSAGYFFNNNNRFSLPAGTKVYFVLDITAKTGGDISLQLTDDSGNVCSNFAAFTTTGHKTAIVTVNSNKTATGWNAYQNNSGTVEISNFMIITEDAYLSGFTDYMPYSLPNTVITPELIDIVDSGAKNLFDWTQSYQFDNCSVNNGAYTTAGDTATTLRLQITEYNDSGVIQQIANDSGQGHSMISSNGVYEFPFTYKGGSWFVIGHNGSTYNGRFRQPTTGLVTGKQYVVRLDVTQATNASGQFKWKDLMICAKTAFDVSQKFVPYKQDPFYQIPINHNMIYRGQNLGDTFTDAQHTALSGGNFTDLYLGDYWSKTVTIPAGTYTGGDSKEVTVPAQTNITLKAVIADFDTFYAGYASSYAGINTHHAAVIVTGFSNVVWNGTNSTAGGYVNSLIHKWLVGSVLPQIETWFGSAKVLSHQKLLTNAITGDAASGWAWSSQKISLLSENQMYGSKVWGNSKASNGGYEPGEAFKHLSVFNHIDANLLFGNKNIWLRDIASAERSAHLDYDGDAGYADASDAWIAPAALILLS